MNIFILYLIKHSFKEHRNSFRVEFFRDFFNSLFEITKMNKLFQERFRPFLNLLLICIRTLQK